MDNSRLTDDDLIRRTEDLVADVRAKTSDLVESLMEVDRRKLYRQFNYVSLFEYCVYTLKMSNAAAYRRIRAARAIAIYPPIGSLLRTGKLTLESIALLHPFLNDVDAGKLVTAAAGKRVWEVERLIASRRTEEPRRDVVRFVSSSVLASTAPEEIPSQPLLGTIQAPSPPESTSTMDVCAAMEPAAAAAAQGPDAPSSSRRAVRVAFTADETFFKLLREVQAAMRHKYPNGRLDGIFRDALQALLRKKRPWAFPKSNGRR